MNELNPSEQRLADQLRRQASSLDIGDTAVATVVRRGQLRRERRRAVVGVIAVLALSGTVIGAIQVLSTPAHHTIISSTNSEPSAETAPAWTTPAETVPSGVASDALTPVNRIDSNLVWNAVEPGTAEALGSGIMYPPSSLGGRPPFLVWSTTPGKAADQGQGPIPMLYRSDDGVHWTPANTDSFTQPQVSMRGTGSRNGRMFAFGTAAATAPIIHGGGGEVVVDVSDDRGSSWRHITLPIDLRGLASSRGVHAVGFQGGMAAGEAGVVAVGVPMVSFDQTVYDSFTNGLVPRRDGATPVALPVCDPGITPTTVSFVGGYTTPSGVNAPPLTAQADAGALGATTTNVGTVGSSPTCTVPVTPQQSEVIPWSDLGVDPAAVAAMFVPRVFVSTDGENFVEGSFPAIPDGGLTSQLSVVATSSGFVATAQIYEASAGASTTYLYTSTDGMAWTKAQLPPGWYDFINVLPDGTIIAFAGGVPGDERAGPFTAVSANGAAWTKMSLASLLDSQDVGARLTVSLAASGASGLTAVAVISHVGVGKTLTTALLHTVDGLNWSRDDLQTVAGFDGYGATRVQVTDTNVLVSMVDSNTRDAQGVAKTVVLVGTPRS